MIQAAFAKLVEGEDLSFDEARASLGEILGGQTPASQIAGFLTALRMKGETSEEIAGCAEAMRGAATRISLSDRVVADTCGTGGDKQGSFNISTAAAFVVAGAGFTVAKHGNRSISSQCGSADVLEALGVKVDPGPAVVEKCLKEIGIGFLFAPAFHPAMKFAMPVRRELGVRTVFNILGPLSNPAGANAQVIGVYSANLVDMLAKVLVRLGTRESMVVHGAGHDEITLSGKTTVAEIIKGRILKRTVSAKDFGLKPVTGRSLRGGNKEKNAEIIRWVLQGEDGPRRDAVAANAAAAILVAARAAGRRDVRTLKDGCQLAEQSIDSGRAREKLELFGPDDPGSGLIMRAGLQEIVRRKRLDLVKQKKRESITLLKERLSKALPVRDFTKAIRKKGRIALIAELKKASPSAGLLRPTYNIAPGVRAYAKGGASALSVLTEEHFFLGHREHLAEAKKAGKLPVLRKDFIVDPYQVVESRVFGADAVLLIVALLKQSELIKLLALTRKLGMTPLVEIHDFNELGRALDAEADVIGVNSRNLKDLSMDPFAFRKIVPFVPPGCTVVAESGIRHPDDVRALKRLKVSAMLVGESLLRQPDLTKAAKSLVEAGKDE